MDTVTILRDIWRLRLYVAGVSLLAALVGFAVLYKISLPPQSRGYEVGVATARILVNTPSSQVVAVSPKGSDRLGWQADLLASLMVDGAIKSAIAQRASLNPNQIVGVTDAATAPSSSGPLPVSAPSGRGAFVLTTHVLTNSIGDNLPIIELDVQAPSRAAAATLAGAAIAGLTDYVASEAALERVPGANRLQVTALGVQVTTERRGPSVVIGFAAVILVLGLGCGGLLAGLALVRSLRAGSSREHLDARELLVWDVGPTPDEYVLQPVGARQADSAPPGTSVEVLGALSPERQPSHGNGHVSNGNGDPSNGNGHLSNGNGSPATPSPSEVDVHAGSQQEVV